MAENYKIIILVRFFVSLFRYCRTNLNLHSVKICIQCRRINAFRHTYVYECMRVPTLVHALLGPLINPRAHAHNSPPELPRKRTDRPGRSSGSFSMRLPVLAIRELVLLVLTHPSINWYIHLQYLYVSLATPVYGLVCSMISYLMTFSLLIIAFYIILTIVSNVI